MFQRQIFPISYFPPSYFPKEGQSVLGSTIVAGRRKAMIRALLQQVSDRERDRQKQKILALMNIRRSILTERHEEEKAYIRMEKDKNNLSLLLTEL